MLMASFGDVISLSRLRGAQIMGSDSRDGASVARAARSELASNGLAARNCRNLRRLLVWSSIGIGDPPYGPNHRRALCPGGSALHDPTPPVTQDKDAAALPRRIPPQKYRIPRRSNG